MPVTDANAIRFCNEQVRVSADKLSQAYVLGRNAIDRWNVLGGGETAVNLMGEEIRSTCDRLVGLYERCYRAEKIWFVLGGTSLIPNNSDQIHDNGSGTAQDPGRPPMTGIIVNNVVTRIIQFQNWLLSQTGSFTDSLRNGVAWYNTVIAPSHDGISPLSVSNAANAISRFTELRDRYQASSNAELNTLLAAAVNPNP